jgi:hypothetical protein
MQVQNASMITLPQLFRARSTDKDSTGTLTLILCSDLNRI